MILHLRSYIPVRKSAAIDLIQERTPVYDVNIQLEVSYQLKEARLVPENQKLPFDGKNVRIPKIDGYAIEELQY